MHGLDFGTCSLCKHDWPSEWLTTLVSPLTIDSVTYRRGTKICNECKRTLLAAKEKEDGQV